MNVRLVGATGNRIIEHGLKMETEAERAGERLELRAEPACHHPFVDAAGNLAFRFGSPGQRYYLDVEGVHAGDLLEMRLDDGAWQVVRFEWDFKPDSVPVLVVTEENCFPMPPGARFRWPDRL